MSSLARKFQQQQQVERTVQVQERTIVKTKKHWLTPGEKIIGIVFTGLVCFGAVNLISNQAEIYQVNKDIQGVQTSINELKKVNSDLELQVSELSSYERIYEKATQMGLIKNENNVKVVHEK
ncbi:cell division protein FtsL [Bacillus sp. EB106-08-02-XG196]|jgi:cell division protein FtsL|uniref:cell division protein FtsL n=1 Tax=Bacillus sp. EB106-08-02-XG196 TaxID=2737049 RepID=UPI0015C4DCF4|nr:cell division protein FtsL [Bacillus sp. EB106-08-02-XG196]NWQ43922.1 cell division protein FtsL [Bacillus sp. EB106-08-02-XG196]